MDTRHIFNATLLAAFLSVSGCGDDGPTPDTTPDAFSFDAVTNAEPGEVYLAAVKITGINARASLVIEGGNFSLDGRNFISSLGAVSNNDTVTVMVVAARTYDTEVKATLSIGDVTADFVVKTIADTEAPELAVDFPPPMSLTDAPLPARLRVRGRVDDNFDVSSVMVNGTAATVDAAGDWFADYDVTNGDNAVAIVAHDTAGNTSTRMLTIRHVENRAGVNFGAGDDFENPVSALWDEGRQRLVLGEAIYVNTVDPLSGNRSNLALKLLGGYGLDFDAVHDRYLSGEALPGAVHEIYPETGVVNELSKGGDGNGADANFRVVEELAVLPDGKKLFARVVNDASDGTHLWVIDIDPASAQPGQRTQFSAEKFKRIASLTLDAARDRLLIGDCDLRALPLSVSTGTLSNSVIASTADFCIRELAVSHDKAWGRSSGGGNFILAIDLVADTYSVVSDLQNAAQGPVVPTAGYDNPPGLDAVRGIYYYFYEGAASGPDTVYAIDLVNGYRVVISQTDG